MGVLFSEQSVKRHVPNGVWGGLEHHLCCLRVSLFGSLFSQVAITEIVLWATSQFHLALLI